MSLLYTLVQEMAAAGSSGADAIANVPGSLFRGGVIDAKKSKKKQRKMMRRIMNMKESLGVDLDKNEFDAADVISKIDAAGKKADQADDTTPFGLEDEDGNIIKVYVKTEQAEQFEKQLAVMLAGEDEDDDDENSSLEIAEVLFKLKDKFDIVDVEWPGIQGDVEEEQEVATDGENHDLNATDGDLTGIEADENGENDSGTEEEVTPDESGAESALSQVIDMMKADAEAKKAEADARAAEARAKEAEYTAQASASMIKKEEQIYDMEASEKRKKEQEKEAQQLAKLAKYQYDKASDAEVKLSMGESKSEDTEDTDDDVWRTNDNNEHDDEVTLKELSQLIMRNLRHN